VYVYIHVYIVGRVRHGPVGVYMYTYWAGSDAGLLAYTCIHIGQGQTLACWRIHVYILGRVRRWPVGVYMYTYWAGSDTGLLAYTCIHIGQGQTLACWRALKLMETLEGLNMLASALAFVYLYAPRGQSVFVPSSLSHGQAGRGENGMCSPPNVDALAVRRYIYMYMYVYTYMYICMYVSMYIHTHAQKDTCSLPNVDAPAVPRYTHTRTHTRTHTHTHTHTRTRTHTHARTHTHTHQWARWRLQCGGWRATSTTLCGCCCVTRCSHTTLLC